MVSPFILPVPAWSNPVKLKNWAGNLEYSTDNITYPTTVKEIQDQVKKLEKLKTLGTRHCFNKIADSKDNLLVMAKRNNVLSLDKELKKVTVEGGINYGELSPYLYENGFALPNLASLPHISVVGGCITATHGSGMKNANLATSVSALEFVAADGTLHTLSKEKNGDQFQGAVVSLGALGVVTQMTLDLQPTYDVRQYVFENLPIQQLRDYFDEIVGASYSVSLFTDWQSDSINEVWLKCLEDEPIKEEWQSEFFGAQAATKNMHPIASLSAENCSEQMGVPGSWFERLPHFKMGFTPSSGTELQSEYFIPHEHAVEAIQAIQKMGKQIGPHLFISEIRTIASDNLWMSPCYHQDSVTIHFTWKQDWPAVSQLLPIIEKELMPFNVTPHWGKLFTLSPRVLRSRYEKLEDFKNLVAEYDPKGKFRNGFLDRNLYSADSK